MSLPLPVKSLDSCSQRTQDLAKFLSAEGITFSVDCYSEKFEVDFRPSQPYTATIYSDGKIFFFKRYFFGWLQTLDFYCEDKQSLEEVKNCILLLKEGYRSPKCSIYYGNLD